MSAFRGKADALSLESAWISFAAELESAEAFLKTMDEIDFKQPYPLEAA